MVLISDADEVEAIVLVDAEEELGTDIVLTTDSVDDPPEDSVLEPDTTGLLAA